MKDIYWPLFDLRLRSGRLVLRPMTEADLTPLAEMKPLDVEQDPSLPSFGLSGVDAGRLGRGVAVHQEYWRSLGTWRPDSWNLGPSTARPWLVTDARGRGIGKTMRLAVLALAFDGLGAEVAETSAWHDNAASLGVSRALGYQDNGVYRHAAGDRVDDMVRMRMTRHTWSERHADHPVHIEGLEPCLPFFGLG